MAAKKKASSKRPAKKAAKRPAAKKSATRKAPSRKSAPKKAKASAKRPVKKAAAKRPAKKVAKAVAIKSSAAKIEIPQVPSSTQRVTPTAPAAPKAPQAPQKKSSPTVLFMVIAGVVLLAIFALTNRSTDEDAAPTPTASESSTTEPSASPSESSSEMLGAHEAPLGFVAINNGNGGVTLRWKAPAAAEGITGYTISISYNAVDFKEVATVPAEQFSLDIAKVSEEGGTQFLIQTVYSDGTKVDGKKFSLKGKYE